MSIWGLVQSASGHDDEQHGSGRRINQPLEHWRYPDDINAKVLEVTDLAYDARDIAQTIAIRVLEAGRVYLVDDALLPPQLGSHVQSEILIHVNVIERNWLTKEAN